MPIFGSSLTEVLTIQGLEYAGICCPKSNVSADATDVDSMYY